MGEGRGVFGYSYAVVEGRERPRTNNTPHTIAYPWYVCVGVTVCIYIHKSLPLSNNIDNVRGRVEIIGR